VKADHDAMREAHRIVALDAALRALVADEPLVNDREDYWRCAFCEADAPVYGPEAGAPFVHEAACPWLRARELLGGAGLTADGT
jgi:hypothetical protein